MISGLNTTFDWQKHIGRICVWSVGAFEQHSSHLPLSSDNIQADFYAQKVAEEFNAALLPNLPYGTSLEHSGFRGTMSLKPETLMNIVRDMADEVERQNFTIMILLNAHGGNFALLPVVRDINRMDRKLKIILAAPHNFVASDIYTKDPESKYDIHASEYETSVMSVMKPELVGKVYHDIQKTPADETIPLEQQDLTTFGIGHFNKYGALGSPSHATKTKGIKILDSLLHNLFAYLHDRIKRLEKQQHYAGPGGITLRQMHPSDMPELMNLKNAAAWNQLENDWSLFLNNNPDGCFSAVHNGRVIGTAATINYNNDISWIGMVLVSSDFRRMGIATQLLNASVNSLNECALIKLDATPDGRKVYMQMGFEDEFTLSRLTCNCVSANFADSLSTSIQTLTVEDIEDVCKLDTDIFATSRNSLLKTLINNPLSASFKNINDKGVITGFCLMRPGCNFTQIGPLVADTVQTAKELLKAQFTEHVGKAILIDVPDLHVELRDWLLENAFSIERPFIRMCKKNSEDMKNKSCKLEHYFSICGPEFG